MSAPGADRFVMDPFSALAKRQRTMMRNALERQALAEGMAALSADGPEAAAEVLAGYARPYGRLLDQERRAEEAT